MENQVSKDTLNKIKALFDKAESSEKIGSFEEAQLFLQKANQLLVKYNLSQSSLQELDKDNETQKSDFEELHINKEFGTYDKELIRALSQANFTTPIFGYGFDGKKFILVGEKQNIEITLYLFNYLRNQLPKIGNNKYSEEVIKLRNLYTTKGFTLTSSKSLAVDLFNQEFPELGVTINDIMPLTYKEGVSTQWTLKNLKVAGLADRGVYLRSFLLGCSIGIKERLKKEREDLIKNSEQELGCTSLTVQSLIKAKQDLNNNFIKENLNTTKTYSRGESASNKEAFNSGVQTGKTISLNKGISSSNQIGIKRLN